MNDEVKTPEVDFNEQITQRREKLTELRTSGEAYPNDFDRNHLAKKLHEQYADLDHDYFEKQSHYVEIAGRIMMRRLMGKACFLHIQDMSGLIQIYIRQEELVADDYETVKNLDLGDIIGVKGKLFKTKTGELTVRAAQVRLLTKALRPLPDKYHGLTDKETCYRQRYLDLIANETTRRSFLIRSRVISAIRKFLDQLGYIEVETPMMQILPGGAAARPFITHHNTLDMDLYLRIAPELYLKRLVVGGFEKVYEINRNFRNEGLSTQHNPEFTMLEFYQAYADYTDLMDLTEHMFRLLGNEVLQTTTLNYQGYTIDLAKSFTRMTLQEAVLKYNPHISEQAIQDIEQLKKIAKSMDISVRENYGLGKLQVEIFEKTVEAKLIQPTFITAFPTEVSPLARKNQNDPFVTDRFELFISGREIANGFSELNDPDDQAERFRKQVQDKEAGDLEAMAFDTDYITALEYGLPPTAGEGIGIDRLVMLFTDAASIRDVILFPHMRPEDKLIAME